MCGIAGYARPGGSTAGLGPEVLERMAQTLWRRGPDEGGCFRDSGCGLAIRRLAVMDPRDGHQPVHDEHGRYQVVYNGEIYNFQTLRQGLEQRGHRLASRSDTEVLPHLWEEHGPDCLQQLQGMFAFAVWDTVERRLFVARDRLGIKPLHYAVVHDTLVFGSELKAVLAFPQLSRELDLVAIDQYLTYDYVPAPRTVFKQIRKLLPGQYLTFGPEGLSLHTWWTPPQPSSNGHADVETLADELRHLLRASVTRMLVADVPLGLFLSGGVDSSTLVALAAPLAPGRLKTFSIGFAERSFDESAHARRVSAFFGTDHSQELLRPQDLPDLLADLGEVLDEPMADAAVVPSYLLSRLTRRSVTVALSGEGGDELFGGYPTYRAARLASYLQHLPSPLLSAATRAVSRLPVNTGYMSLDFKLRRFFGYLEQPPGPRHILWVGSFGPGQKERLLLPDVQRALDAKALWEPVDRLGEADDVADMVMRLDLSLYLGDDLLVKLDRSAMAVSLEGRVPFLDEAVVDFARRLPRHLKVTASQTKVLLKRAVEPLLPPGIANRPKQGFGVPVARWLKRELQPLLHETLAAERVRSWGLVDERRVATLVAEHEAGQHDHRKLLWNLMVFSLWWERWAR